MYFSVSFSQYLIVVSNHEHLHFPFSKIQHMPPSISETQTQHCAITTPSFLNRNPLPQCLRWEHVCCHFSRVQLCGPWTAALQGSLSMGFPRQESWRGLPWPPPEDLPSSGTEPMSLMSPELAGRFFTTSLGSGSPR